VEPIWWNGGVQLLPLTVISDSWTNHYAWVLDELVEIISSEGELPFFYRPGRPESEKASAPPSEMHCHRGFGALTFAARIPPSQGGCGNVVFLVVGLYDEIYDKVVWTSKAVVDALHHAARISAL